MKIIMLSRVTPHHRKGGLESHTETLATALKERNIDISIVTSSHPEGKSRSTLGGVPVFHLPGTKPGEYTIGFFRIARKWIDNYVKDNPVDIVHSQGFAALGFKSRKKYKLITTIHGTLLSETALSPSLRKEFGPIKKLGLLWRYKKRLAIAPQYRRLLKVSDRIITDSLYTKTLLPTVIQKKVSIVQLGILLEPYLVKNHEQSRRNLKWDDENICVSVGRMNMEKGFQVAIQAISRLPNVKYYLVGTGPYQDTLKSIVKDLGLEDRIIFTGRISEKDLPSYYSAADLFLMPELGDTAFGLVLVESMAAGTPAIAADSGAIKEVIYNPEEFTYNKHDFEKLAELISEHLRDKAELADLRTNVRDFASERYQAGRMADEMIKIYESVL
jgi:glycosyltransferase involved in cell wall biosynthesis